MKFFHDFSIRKFRNIDILPNLLAKIYYSGILHKYFSIRDVFSIGVKFFLHDDSILYQEFQER